ncbi:hypothetical protein ACT7DF_23040 [Bacillus cereus]
MKDVELHLIDHLKKINTAPFLFIGSGFSKRYLNLEDWAGLMKKFSNLMPYEFEYYSSTGGTASISEKNHAKRIYIRKEPEFTPLRVTRLFNI